MSGLLLKIALTMGRLVRVNILVHRYDVQMRWGNTQEHTDHGDRQSGGRGEHKEKTQEVRING